MRPTWFGLTTEIGAFNVVDGQHRIRGLVLAAEKDPSLDDFEVAVNIAVNLNPITPNGAFPHRQHNPALP